MLHKYVCDISYVYFINVLSNLRPEYYSIPQYTDSKLNNKINIS